QGVSRAIIDQGKMIRVPVYMNEEILKYKKTIEKLTHKLKRIPRVGEVAKRMKVSVDRIRELDRSIAKMSSLDAPIGDSGEGQVKDIIEDVNVASPDAQLEVFFDKERAIGFLELLNARERKIVELRYGLEDGNTHTLAEIAKTLGVSRERVRQIEAATIKKIRQIVQQKEQEQDGE
ncbi:MAG: sigma-70 family RNA polymerase sigma factor, partial [Candidatus Omnitrophica bacterium]|nr:sigma-70 family RNA polymerase sigma factor [Candidatus Omnitrophota bacterium]